MCSGLSTLNFAVAQKKQFSKEPITHIIYANLVILAEPVIDVSLQV